MTSMVKSGYNIQRMNDKIHSVIYYHGDEFLTADGSHPRINDIVEAITADETDLKLIRTLFSTVLGITAALADTAGQIEIRNREFYYNGRLLNGTLANAIVKAYEQGTSEYSRLISFFNRVQANPSAASTQHLYRWLDNNSFSIDAEGFIVGYKGVSPQLKSIHAGPGIVNGVATNGNLDNSIGNTVEMNRSEVTFDPNNACSFGLHVGTWDYAKSFSRGTVVTVRVDPADVVSVPSDHNNAKMRVCKYKVLAKTDMEYENLFYDYDDDDDDYDEDYW